MNQDTLHRLRYIIPGALLILVALSVFVPGGFFEQLKGKDVKDYSVAGGALLAVALVYHVLDLRRRIGFLSWAPVHSNIRDRLLGLLPELRAEEIAYLRNERRILDIFYSLIDSNDSQKVKQSRVRFNGLLVSSCHDIVAVSMLGATAHMVALVVTRNLAHTWWAVGLVIGALVVKFGLARLAMSRHMELSGGQIDFIADHQQQKLRELTKTVLQGLPPNGAPRS